MKVIEHYKKAKEPLISFEIIPPKRGGSVQHVFDSLDLVMQFKPPFIDVTSHAAEAYYEELSDGNIKRHIKRKRPGTIGLCAAIKHRYGVDPVPHLVCKGFTKEETEDALIELNYLGIDNVLAIRGDNGTPKPIRKDRSINEYAIDLVRQIKKMNEGVYLEDLIDAAQTNFCVGVGGYPEKHFEAPNLAWDIKRLKEKVDAGADYIVTQMFYDNDAFFKFVDDCKAEGIKVPIIPGLKVVTTTRHMKSLPSTFHVNLPNELADAISKDPEHVKDIGIEWTTKQCKELLDKGVPGLHFYIMANPKPVIDVIESLPLGQSLKV
ncbi:MAG TPA: methylenetetrahydrofolate reductase [NAD(P)H] [Balneolales bacterium]|nr:methylenetetrahydrofolate reductase [NAD(P)H] [Balneolales bacterium]